METSNNKFPTYALWILRLSLVAIFLYHGFRSQILEKKFKNYPLNRV